MLEDQCHFQMTHADCNQQHMCGIISLFVRVKLNKEAYNSIFHHIFLPQRLNIDQQSQQQFLSAKTNVIITVRQKINSLPRLYFPKIRPSQLSG